MLVKLLTEHHLAFLSLNGGCTGSSVSTLVKMPHCQKSHAVAHLEFLSLHGGCTGSSESTLVKMLIVGNHMPRLILEHFLHITVL